MKNILLVGTALMMLAPLAFASKARLQALGEDKDGSLYISDYRNAFINPAEVNKLSNQVIFEWGDSGKTLGNASLDTDSRPKAQGGFFHTLPNGMKTGFILGDESDVAALTRILSSNGGTSAVGFMQTADNVLDFFLAGNNNVNWGLDAYYTKSKSETTGSRYDQHSYGVRLGASKDAWSSFALVSLGADASAPDLSNAPTYKGKLGFRIGGGYDLNNENKAFALYESYAWKQASNALAERQASFNKAVVGIGHTKKVTDSSTLFAKINGELVNIKLNAVASTVEATINRLVIPVTVGYEFTATDWLVLRGSVVQNLYGTVKDQGLAANFSTANGATIRSLAYARYGTSINGTGGKKTINNSTNVDAGMTLKFGKLELDGSIGTTDGARGVADSATTNVTETKAGVLALDNLMTRVGLTYTF
jgi:hypothetical protein